ncbi:MAG: TrbC/VirB2 family protein [Hydrogenophaga sp.]|uniref:TrbC/VirB2 family protein n=1 Tax=Hydrogenophaga sp. TaxID=1904254 RepID=UPI003D101359
MKEVHCFGPGPVRFECSAQRLAVLCVVAVALFVFSHPALAQTAATADPFAKTALATALGSLVAALNGAIARSLAIIAVIGMGIAALTGRVEWSRAIVVVLGVGLIFSAGVIINALFPVPTT